VSTPRIREHPKDFIVEEIATIDPVEDGDHLLMQVEATDLDHHSMVRRLAEAHGVDRRQVGWAGMKDKRAVTRQWITIKTPGEAVLVDDEDLKICEALRCSKRRRPGALLGNRFEIIVRGVEPTELLSVMPAMRTVAEQGLPNRFGPQRFGHRGINPILGRAMLLDDTETLLRSWLGQEGPAWPEGEIDRRRLFDQGRFEDALRLWPKVWNAERSALAALHRTGRTEDAVRSVQPRIRGFWVDALQSVLFNDVLARREADGLLQHIGDDDIVSVFSRFHDFLGDTVGPERVATGPLFGRNMRPAGVSVAAVEREVLAQHGLDEALFKDGRSAPGGARRPFVVPVLRAAAESGVDDRGGYLKLKFSLPRGAYATTLLSALGLDLD